MLLVITKRQEHAFAGAFYADGHRDAETDIFNAVFAVEPHADGQNAALVFLDRPDQVRQHQTNRPVRLALSLDDLVSGSAYLAKGLIQKIRVVRVTEDRLVA